MLNIDCSLGLEFEKKMTEYFLKYSDLNELIIRSNKPIHLIFSDHTESIENPFNDIYDLQKAIQLFSFSKNIRLDPNSPSAGGMLGSSMYRWHTVIPPLSPDGVVFSLRRHSFNEINFEDFIDSTGLTQDIENIMNHKKSFLICGKTGSGKSTFLHALMERYLSNKRVAILETLNELPAHRDGWFKLLEHKVNIQGLGGVSIEMLMMDALRLRPDCIVIGELRGTEVTAFIDALTTGHQNVMATIHGESKLDIVNRFSYLLSKARYQHEYIKQTIEYLRDMPVVCLRNHGVPEIYDVFYL